jgi:UDP-N-acetyl-2-amino-2-deoxyglucuronate dehydrogenase
LTWIFGEVKENIVHVLRPEKAAGLLHLQKARVRWFLSLDYQDNSQATKEKGIRTFRSLTVENEEIEFSEGFTDLHTESYRQLLAGNGFGMKEARNSVEIAHRIRNSTPIGITGDYHPILKTIQR